MKPLLLTTRLDYFIASATAEHAYAEAAVRRYHRLEGTFDNLAVDMLTDQQRKRYTKREHELYHEWFEAEDRLSWYTAIKSGPHPHTFEREDYWPYE